MQMFKPQAKGPVMGQAPEQLLRRQRHITQKGLRFPALAPIGEPEPGTRNPPPRTLTPEVSLLANKVIILAARVTLTQFLILF